MATPVTTAAPQATPDRGTGGPERQLGHAEHARGGREPDGRRHRLGRGCRDRRNDAPQRRVAACARGDETVEPAPSTPANVSNDATSTADASDGPLVAPIVPAAAGLPFEPFPLGSSSPANGPSPFGLVFLGVGAVALILFFFGPRGRGLVGYWASEARLALFARRRSGG